MCRVRKVIICVAFFSKFCQTSTFYSILYLILRFTKEEAGVRKQALPLVPARYIRIFDVISKVNCVLLWRKRRFEKIAPYTNFDLISEVKLPSFTKEEVNFRLKSENIPVHNDGRRATCLVLFGCNSFVFE